MRFHRQRQQACIEPALVEHLEDGIRFLFRQLQFQVWILAAQNWYDMRQKIGRERGEYPQLDIARLRITAASGSILQLFDVA